MIFTGEGKNKTEKQYFLSFQEQHGKYSIQFVNTGFDTDPAGMLKSMESAWKRYELSVKNIDCNPMTDVTEILKELDVV